MNIVSWFAMGNPGAKPPIGNPSPLDQKKVTRKGGQTKVKIPTARIYSNIFVPCLSCLKLG